MGLKEIVESYKAGLRFGPDSKTTYLEIGSMDFFEIDFTLVGPDSEHVNNVFNERVSHPVKFAFYLGVFSKPSFYKFLYEEFYRRVKKTR